MFTPYFFILHLLFVPSFQTRCLLHSSLHFSFRRLYIYFFVSQNLLPIYFAMPRFVYFFTLAVALFFSSVMAAPLESNRRQIGNLACNIARLKTVAGLSKSASAIQAATSAATGDAATTSQLQTASQGISSAQDGVAKIAAALLTGQQAPAADRQQVQDGLTAASTALGSITAADPDVDSAVANASSAVEGTTEAGAQVVSDC
ncbi:hypothetical protein D9613_010043 [Agrocybe pediades]|uniref:Uncharacterized protein n=1 Tax=Agrocybe pediades TaxID=84607 RepID=A0A8H4QY50_9AGAR|nr:hypothetical protein D9613_010043 [Agrocybe pediades]